MLTKKKEYWIINPLGRTIYIENTNKLLWKDTGIIAGKTGYTGNARHCFVGAARTDNGIYIVAIMGVSSRNRLWRYAESLFDITEGTKTFKVKGRSKSES